MSDAIDDLIARFMLQSNRPVPARLQAAMALLERLFDDPTLELGAHLAAKGSSGLASHETFGKKAHAHFDLAPINKIHGRRSSNLGEWGAPLLEIVRATNFETMNSRERENCIRSLQQPFAARLRAILEQEPLVARISGRSAVAVVKDVIKQADEKGKAGEVAQYLVAAKLELRFGRKLPLAPANKGDRKSRNDPNARLGDFEIDNTVIEIALGLPDEKHLTQVCESLEDSEKEIWLITRMDRVGTWSKELEYTEGVDVRRVVTTSVEAFVGQNVSELGEFTTKGKAKQLRALFALYNERWVSNLGTPGIRVDVR